MNRMRIGWAVLIAWAIPALLAIALLQQWIELPDRWNPWAPIWPQDPPNLLTPWKLSRLAADPHACTTALAATTLTWQSIPDRPLAEGCGWSNAVRVSALPARIGAPVVLACPAAVSLAMWERHALQPAAEATFGSRVTGLEHYGSYACRDIGGGTRSPGEGSRHRSQHATANALDVAGFVLADGRTIRVDRDWSRPADDAHRRFLQAARDGACRIWGVVLGPDYNAAHHDHFHLDRGRFRACR